MFEQAGFILKFFFCITIAHNALLLSSLRNVLCNHDDNPFVVTSSCDVTVCVGTERSLVCRGIYFFTP